MVLVDTNGRMEEYTQENGSTIKCREKEFLLGLMVENIKGTTFRIEKKDLEYLHLKTVEFMKVNG